MKLPSALIVWLMLCSTSALAFQEKPSPEMPLPSAAAKTTAISRFAADENDVAIAQAYSPGTFTSTAPTSRGFPAPAAAVHHH
ncbi:hypothetical protein ACHQIS_17775 [Raoultella ornithinolytica]|jgi:hypothetical protein|uniref:hypothetical protein n=1 Tax=Raoultella ornithinolytica TaxID=54291 RepID=UPI0019514B54|nr:hypothetical protein [Raoultella ornithinolytica]MBM6479840.1 hypothetical protein [Raoultella ornithinolytica]MCF6652123.1 hypothetical protein [Raoultella ornithinolytica]MCF6703040.1 hypothetical protein [Raoultella ornithinolytica]QSA14609.1 hypothetical protein JV207_09315 [Raoultella ornithinolytica]HAT1600257.1 hypothetical protein [Raoultella ornithinolytica]